MPSRAHPVPLAVNLVTRCGFAVKLCANFRGLALVIPSPRNTMYSPNTLDVPFEVNLAPAGSSNHRPPSRNVSDSSSLTWRMG
ncbi:hypothetical protein AnigIFM49718_008271 [Aspergillus niger]|nr:hypothetical protein AnigIFM49718_008271 [Aspergillus niger]